MTFSKISVLLVFAQVTAFGAATLLFTWYGKEIPDALTAGFYSWVALEIGLLTALKFNDRKWKPEKDLEKENDELRGQLAEAGKASRRTVRAAERAQDALNKK